MLGDNIHSILWCLIDPGYVRIGIRDISGVDLVENRCFP